MQTLQRPLGFGESPRTLYVYAHRANGNQSWFHLTDGEPVELQPALTGFLKAIEFPTVQRRQKDCHKLHITMKAHRLVVVECGHDSNFAKGFLLAIAQLQPEQLKQLLTLEAQPGQDEAVLFCSVWIGSKLIKCEWTENTNWRAVAQKAMANVRAVQQG